MTTVLGSDDDSRMISLSFLQWVAFLLLKLQLALWIDMWLEKILINLQPGWRIMFRGSKVEKILFNQLFMLTIEPSSFCCCLEVIFSSMR